MPPDTTTLKRIQRVQTQPSGQQSAARVQRGRVSHPPEGTFSSKCFQKKIFRFSAFFPRHLVEEI